MTANELIVAVFLKSFSWDAWILVSILLALAGMAFGVYTAIKSLQNLLNKNELIEQKMLPEMVSKFGKAVSTEINQLKRLVRFERNGTVFELKVTPISDGSGLPTKSENIVQFRLPNLDEKFYIQHKSFFFSKKYSDCQEVQAAMLDDFFFYSLNPQFLVNLIAKDRIRNELYKYQKEISREFSIAFKDGLFTAVWHRGQLDNNKEVSWDTVMNGETANNEMQKLEQICQTAVVFYDEITALQGKS